MLILLHQTIFIFTVFTFIIMLAFTIIFFALAFKLSLGDLSFYKKPREFREPVRWSPPGAVLRRGPAERQLDEAMVYKELANYVNRLYHDGRISLEVRNRVLGELEDKLRRVESGQGDSKASS
ncbi:MAG: hypothetical protein QXX87_02420 [Candidatus Jordarchaeales archaeon]